MAIETGKTLKNINNSKFGTTWYQMLQIKKIHEHYLHEHFTGLEPIIVKLIETDATELTSSVNFSCLFIKDMASSVNSECLLCEH